PGCWSPTTSTRRGGSRTGSCGSTAGRSSSRGRSRSSWSHEPAPRRLAGHLDPHQPRRGRRQPRAGRPGRGRLALAPAELEEDIAVAVLRSLVQLTAIGYVIKAIFDEDSLALVFALIAVMVVFGAIQARQRARRVPGAFWPLLVALALAGVCTLGLVIALGIFDPSPRYLVPVGGMVVGNAMTAAAVALNRLGDEMRDRAREIEATLALGATATVAAAPTVRRALRSGVIALVDSTKTTGLIFFPGTMVGM